MINYDFHDLSKRTDVELEQQITEGFTFGDYNSTENGMFLISRDAPTPDEKEIVESVPYMQGVYDFSTLNGGERYFDNRQITYQVMLFNEDYGTRKGAEQEIKRSLMSLKTQALYDTHDTGYHWLGKAKSVTVEDDAKMNTLAATITFDCYPFAIYNRLEGSDVWDDVYFPHWVFQQISFSVPNESSADLINIGSKTVMCSINVVGKVTVTGDFGSVTLTDGNHDDTIIVLAIGENHLQLSGNGNITFNFYREEII